MIPPTDDSSISKEDESVDLRPLLVYVVVADAKGGVYRLTFERPPETSLPRLNMEDRTWNNGLWSEDKEFGQYSRWAENMPRGMVIGVFDIHNLENLRKLSEVKFNASHRVTPTEGIIPDRRR